MFKYMYVAFNYLHISHFPIDISQKCRCIERKDKVFHFVVKEPQKDTTLSESETFINLRRTLVHNVFIFVKYKTSKVVLIYFSCPA